jgi:hypothetical protein
MRFEWMKKYIMPPFFISRDATLYFHSMCIKVFLYVKLMPVHSRYEFYGEENMGQTILSDLRSIQKASDVILVLAPKLNVSHVFDDAPARNSTGSVRGAGPYGQTPWSRIYRMVSS